MHGKTREAEDGVGGLVGLVALLFSTQIDLTQFGLESVNDVGYVSIGVMHFAKGDQVRVYDVRKEGPPRFPSEKIVGKDPAPGTSSFVVSRFDEGNRNALNGYFNVFNSPGARATAYLSDSKKKESALVFEFDRKDKNNFCGFWVQLFDSHSTLEQRVYFDTSAYQFLTFQIRADKTDLSFVLKAADARLNASEDAKIVGNIAQFLPGGITTNWQTVKIPLSYFEAELDRKSMANLVFQATDISGKVLIRDLVFHKTDTPPSLRERAQNPKQRNLRRAIWLWETKEIQSNQSKTEELLLFAKRIGLTDIFLQVPYEARHIENDWRIVWDELSTRKLVHRLNALGIKVHALDGDPSFGLKKNHGRQLALVKRIIDFNKDGPKSERFAGIRYDNEVYLSPNFYGKAKQVLLAEFVELLKKTKSLTKKADLEFGVDIPFWFDARNAFGEFEAPYGEQNVMTAILNIVDNIGIMDYRTVAYGADGVIAHAEQKLIQAQRLKKSVFVGLETVTLPDETIYEFEGVQKATNNLFITPISGSIATLSWPKDKAGAVQKAIALRRKTEVLSSKMTFQSLPVSDLIGVMNQTQRELSGYRSFAGIVLHSYESLHRYLGDFGLED